jgi:hypothetical protein
MHYHRRRFFIISSSSFFSTTSGSSPPPAAASASSYSLSLPAWLTHYLTIWEQQSGTHEILQLKQNVNTSSLEFDTKQQQVTQARQTVDKALQSFEACQLKHTRLLQTRDRWTSLEAIEFAKILEEEVQVRSELEVARKDLALLEQAQLDTMHRYMSDLRIRYQEEQLWQDKWRIYSTYGTWGLIVLNSIVFMCSQYMVRLRENRRMKEIQESIRQSLATNEGTLRAIQEGQHTGRDRGENNNMDDGEGKMQNDKVRHGVVTTLADKLSNKKESLISAKAVDNDEDGDDDGTDITPVSTNNDDDDGRCYFSSDITKLHEQSQRIKSIISSTTLHCWSTVRRFTTNAATLQITSKEGEEDDGIVQKVDIPSAILGASVTGLVWLIVAIVIPGKNRN